MMNIWMEHADAKSQDQREEKENATGRRTNEIIGNMQTLENEIIGNMQTLEME